MVFELKSDKIVKISLEKYLANTLEDLDVKGIVTDNLFVTIARSQLLEAEVFSYYYSENFVPKIFM